MSPDARLKELLRALPPGQRMWMRAGGTSLWPLLLDGDSLQVLRTAPGDLEPGDVAVVALGDTFVAHLVARVSPLVTVSSVGVIDPPASEVLGRVIAFRRRGVEVPLPRGARHLLRLVPTAAALAKSVPGLRALVRTLRDRR